MKIYIPTYGTPDGVFSVMDTHLTRRDAERAIEEYVRQQMQPTASSTFHATSFKRARDNEGRLWVMYRNDEVLGCWQLWVRKVHGSPLAALAEAAD